MNPPAACLKASRRSAVERTYAPQVEEGWAEDFVIEPRLLGLVGPDRRGAQ